MLEQHAVFSGVQAPTQHWTTHDSKVAKSPFTIGTTIAPHDGYSVKKKPIRIFDAYGEKIFQIHVDDPSKGLAGLRLDTFHVPYAKLPAMDLSGCEMYWPLLEGADLSFCNFQDAVLAGANMNHCILRHANLRRTRLVADAMGYCGSMLGADLTSALLDEACSHDVEYDDTTLFPKGFDPILAGMKKSG